MDNILLKEIAMEVNKDKGSKNYNPWCGDDNFNKYKYLRLNFLDAEIDSFKFSDTFYVVNLIPGNGLTNMGASPDVVNVKKMEFLEVN